MADNNKKPKTKSAILAELAEATNMKRKDVAALFDALNGIIKKEVSKKGPGVINVLRLVKVYRKDIAASKGGETKINRLNGQTYVTKPKPARSVIKVRPLKDLKDMV
jgi:hypothetical protein